MKKSAKKPVPKEGEVKERPIMFSGEMVRALLAGTKTQTRRVVKPQPQHIEWFAHQNGWCARVRDTEPQYEMVRCPYGVPGDRLWVREAWCNYGGKTIYRADYGAHTPISDGIGGPWKPSIHMPRQASRLTLEITAVRVERVQSISEEDALAEGLTVRIGDGTGPGPGFKWNGPAYQDASTGNYHVPDAGGSGVCCCYEGRAIRRNAAVCAFASLWDRINGNTHPWASNPWVWVVEFRRLP